MKKIIVGIFSFVLLFAGQSVFANSGPWNSASNDCPTINVANTRGSVGWGNPCWNGTNISAQPGDIINVRIYYHNTGSATASNTRLILNAQTGSSTNHAFSANITSSQGGLSSGQVSINLPSSQTLTFGSVDWYTGNTNPTITSLLNGQNGSEILSSSGLYIGDITAGWPSQGSAVVSFVVGNNTPPPVLNCSINSFIASPTSITNGDFSMLYWATNNCAHVTIDGIGSVELSGSRKIWPTYSTTYTLVAEDQNGNTSDRETVSVNVDNNNYNTCSINSFTASPTYTTSGSSSSLNWNTSNCSNVTISNLGYNVPTSGSQAVWPTYTTTYTLTAYGTNNGIQTRSVTVSVDNNNYNTCSINSFTASNTYLNQGDSTTLQWSTSNCNSISISNIGNVVSSGSRLIYPTGTTNYVLSAYGNRSDSRSIQINVNNIPIIIPAPTPIYNSNVVTTVATNVSQTGAQINGLITNSNIPNVNTHFEYGTDVSLGSRTTPRLVSGNTSFTEYLSGLSPKTIYFFQAVSEGTNGVSRGAIEVFQTLGTVNNNQVVKQVVVQGKTVYGSQSPIMLKIENRYQSIGVGDVVDYVVSYKNISSSKLTHPMVQVFIPKGITLTNLSQGTYSEDSRTLSVPINDLNPNDEGVIYIQAKVDNTEANLAQIVTTAVLVYTNPNGAQENAMAYVLNNPKTGNNNLLGASAFFGNIFGLGLIGWLLFIILIMILILVVRTFYGKKESSPTPTNH